MQTSLSPRPSKRTSETSFTSLLASSSQSGSPPRSIHPYVQVSTRRPVPLPTSRSRSLSRASGGISNGSSVAETPLISVQFASRRYKEGVEHRETLEDIRSANSDDSLDRLEVHFRDSTLEDNELRYDEGSSMDSAIIDNIIGGKGISADAIGIQAASMERVLKLENHRVIGFLQRTCYNVLRKLDYEPTAFGESPPLKYESDYERDTKGTSTEEKETEWKLQVGSETKSHENIKESTDTLDSAFMNNTLEDRSVSIHEQHRNEIPQEGLHTANIQRGSSMASDYDFTDSDMEYFKGKDDSEYGENDDSGNDVEEEEDASSSGSAVDDSLIDEEFGDSDSGDDLDSDDYITDSESVTESFEDFNERRLDELKEKQEKEVQNISQISFLPSRRRKSSSALQGVNAMTLIASKNQKDEKKAKEDMLRELFVKQEVHVVSTAVVSKLSSLINTKTISLDYYKYVGEKQKNDDVLKIVRVSIPALAQKIDCKINTNVTIVELIGYILWKVDDKSAVSSNDWKCYLGDEGEIEDDFGVLERTREIKSYGGADEFVLVECNEEERVENEKNTPSPIEQIGESGIKVMSSDNGGISTGGVMDVVTGEVSVTPIVGSPESLESNTTKRKQAKSTVTPRNTQNKQSQQQRRSKTKLVKRKPIPSATLSPSLQTQKLTKMDTRLNLKKTKNTIQTILHNTADKYADTKKELFNGDHEGDEQGYYSWTVWRRQHMTFKTKLPKTLTIDGYQIYLLPFNEYKGSWYESKSYNFHISQVLKVSINSKASNYFKIVIKKNTEGVVKKYYLEAVNEKECRDIVGNIRKLAKSYK